MKLSYQVKLQDFGLIKKNYNTAQKITACHEIDDYCILWTDICEMVRNEVFEFPVEVQTIRSLKKIIKQPYRKFNYRLAIVNCDLFDEVESQLAQLVEKSNQCDGFCPADFKPRNIFGYTATRHIKQFLSLSMHGYFEGLYPESEISTVAGLAFCNPQDLAAIQGPREKLLRTMYFSFCSWRFDDNSKLTDPSNCFVTLVFTIYDHAAQSLFDARLNVASVQWIEEQSKNQALTFLRYILIVEKFDIDVIMQHVNHTVERVAEQEDSGHGYAIGDLSFGYELPREKLEIADDDNAPFAM
jgi:hypothetical protein